MISLISLSRHHRRVLGRPSLQPRTKRRTSMLFCCNTCYPCNFIPTTDKLLYSRKHCEDLSKYKDNGPRVEEANAFTSDGISLKLRFREQYGLLLSH